MAEQNNVLQLKRLAAKMTNKTPQDIKGHTIADILDVIQGAYSGGGGGGVTITGITLNVNSCYGVNNGTVTMSDGTTLNINISFIDNLTLTSQEGSAKAKTVITVDPPLQEGNSYRYSVGSDTTIPATGEDLSTWTEWDGTSEIEVANATKLRLAECDTQCKAVKCGIVTVKAPIF